MPNLQRAFRLALAAAFAAGPLAAQDAAAARTRVDTTRGDTARVESDDVSATQRDTTPLEPTPTETPSGFDTGVIRPGPARSAPVAAPTADRPSAASTGKRPSAGVIFIDARGSQIGLGTLTQVDRGLLITAELSGLPPGEHAFHVHQTGRCDPPSFQSAGDHYAPQGGQHGFLASGGPHAGDLPNRRVTEGGRVNIEEFTSFVTLTGGDSPLLDRDGSALILHARADDYRSQPSGDAGDRIACAVVQRTGGTPP
jgi:Cu-Zn family superoxide dismutase